MLEEELTSQINKYSKILKEAELKFELLPKGNLRISRTGKEIRFFVTMQNDLKEMYVPKTSPIPQKLAQAKYLEKSIKILGKLITQMKILKKNLEKRELIQVYEKMHPQRKAFITPIELPDKEYIETWQRKPYLKKGFEEHAISYLTNKGEKVRSKSEVIIANALNFHKVPYRYEYPFVTKYGKTMYPDFLVLNKRTRKEFLFEHFGMMDNPEYSSLFCFKMKTYQDEGFYPGINLLFTTETSKVPIDMQILNNLITTFLL